MVYEVIARAAELTPHLPALLAAKVIGLDLETTGLDPRTDRIRLVQLAVEGLPALLLDADTFLPGGVDLLRRVLTTPAVKVLQNAKFDLQFLMALDIYPAPLFDTMLAGRLLYMPGTPRRANLETLVQHYLGEEIDKTEQTGDWRGPLRPAQLAYAARDAQVLLRLRHAMLPLLRQAGLVRVAAIEFACVRAIAQMEYRGIALDRPAWHALAERTRRARDVALEALYEFTGRPVAQTTLWGEDEVQGISLDSNAYVLRLLNANGVPVTATSKGDLHPYREHPLVRALSAYRKAAKALSSILLPVESFVHPATGRLHPQYGQIGAYSGRMSCGGPNIQQIPRDPAFRDCFLAPPGRALVIADYSQIELRVAAQIAGDERMLAAYAAGEDLHALTASLMTGVAIGEVDRRSRQAAKAVNFGLIYGMGAAGLVQYAGQSYGVEMGLADAELFRRRFFEAYSGIAAWHQRIKAHPGREGRTLTGRRFPVSSTPSLPELSNAPVQGSAADVCKLALGRLVDRLSGGDAWVIACVHDEIMLECPQGVAEAMCGLLRETMEAAAAEVLPRVPVPVEAKAAASWAEK